MKRRERKIQARKRKNFFPLLVITIILWLIWAGMVYFIDPDAFGAIPSFFFLMFLALFFTTAILFENSKRGFIIAASLTFFAFLRFLGVGNILNLLLLLGLVITAELFFSKK